MMIRPYLALLAVASGCATVTTKENVTETALRSLESRGVKDDSRTYDVTATVDGDRVVLSVDQAETCWLKTTPRKQRTKRITRELDSKTIGAVWLVAGFCGLVGGYFIADPQGVADSINSDPAAEPTTPEDVRSSGVLMFSIGVGAAAVAVVDHVRAIDSEQDGGIIEGDEEVDEFTCHGRDTSNEAVTLVLADGTELTGTTDRNGRAEFSLTNVSEAAISGREALFPTAPGSMNLIVHGTETVVRLSDFELEKLIAALAANPASRVASDILAKRQRACQKHIEQSRSMDLDDPEAVMKRWSTAKAECDDLWTAQLDIELAETKRKVAAARCSGALERAGTALSGDVDRNELDAADADLKVAESTCKDENAGRMRAMQARLTKATRQVEQEERQARRRAELQRRIATLERALRDGRAEEAWELLYLEPDLRPIAAEQLKDVAWDALSSAVDDVIAARPTRSAAETHMCFVRKVFTLIVGRKELRNAVQRYVSAVGTRDPAMASKVVGALKAGRCAHRPAAKKTASTSSPAADTTVSATKVDPDSIAAVAKGDPYIAELRADLDWQPPPASPSEEQLGCIRLNRDGTIGEIQVKPGSDNGRNSLREPVWNALQHLKDRRNALPDPVPTRLLDATRQWLCFRFIANSDGHPVHVPMPQSVPPTLLEGSRVSGDKMIVPDDLTKTEILRSGKDRIIGSFKMCLTSTGAVSDVTMLKSTGFPAYDRKIQSTIQDEWRYRPYVVNGAATPVCTAVSFIYSQR